MERRNPAADGSALVSVRSLLAGSGGGGTKIQDLVFSASSLKVCCFKAKTGWLLGTKTKLLDARSARLRGSSLLVPDVPGKSPADPFEFKAQGWLLDRNERRMGDVMDLLIDQELRIREFVANLRHNLIVPEDTIRLLSKEARKNFMRRIPDVSAPYTGDAYTLVSVPARIVSRIKADPLFYEVLVNISLDDLTNSTLRALQTGRSEKGLVRQLFQDLIGEIG